MRFAVPFPADTASRETSPDAIAIGAQNLSKRFGDFEAVKNVSLEVTYGEIYGLLGANGAGKTTTIKMLCGLIDPTCGEALSPANAGFVALRNRAAACRIHVAKILPLRRSHDR